MQWRLVILLLRWRRSVTVFVVHSKENDTGSIFILLAQWYGKKFVAVWTI
jgi:hypothetical protein